MATTALTALEARAPRAEGLATVLAIGTATPHNCVCVYQADYPDYYFRVTNSDHLPDLKQKFKQICKFVEIFEKTTISIFLIKKILILQLHI